MKKLLCLIGGAMLLTNILAQKITPLTVGDTIPDLTFSRIVNYKAKSARLSDFKDRMVILDFWATWCTSCLAAIPHAQMLQKEFGDSIIVLLVNSIETRDTKEKIANLFNRKPNLKIPSIVEDTILTKLFPHQGIPHYVWVKNNVVRAITSAKEVTETNIRSMFSDQTKKLPIKNDFPSFNINGPLYTDTAVLKNIIEHSILTSYSDRLQSISSGATRDEHGRLTCLYFINMKLASLYAYAYPVLHNYSQNRILKSTSILDSIYCYDLQLPPAKDEIFLQRMQEDLHKAFHLTVEEEVRPTRCLVLTKKGNTSILFDTLTAAKSTLYGDFNNRYIRNLPMSLFINALNSKYSVPVINETGITSPITINDLPLELSDFQELRAALVKYGLDIQYATRELKMCIIQKTSESTGLNN